MSSLNSLLNRIDKLKWRPTEAIRLAQEGLLEYPENERLLKRIGILYRANGEYQMSAFYLDNAHALYPESVPTANELAKTLAKMGKCDEAKHLLLSIRSPDAHTFRTLADILEKEGKADVAEAVFLKGRSLHPDDKAILVSLAAFYLRRHDFESFAKLLDGSVSLIKNSRSHIELMATAAFMLGETEKAKRLCLLILWGHRHCNTDSARLYMAITEGKENDPQRIAIEGSLPPALYRKVLEDAAYKYGAGGAYAPVVSGVSPAAADFIGRLGINFSRPRNPERVPL